MDRLRDTAALDRWIDSAAPGDAAEYHRGYLARDIAEGPALLRLAEAAYAGWRAGRVHLVQRRHGPGDYSYLAIARPERRR